MSWGAISTPSRVQQHIDVHGGGAQPTNDVIAHAHSNYHHVAAALRCGYSLVGFISFGKLNRFKFIILDRLMNAPIFVWARLSVDVA